MIDRMTLRKRQYRKTLDYQAVQVLGYLIIAAIALISVLQILLQGYASMLRAFFFAIAVYPVVTASFYLRQETMSLLSARRIPKVLLRNAVVTWVGGLFLLTSSDNKRFYYSILVVLVYSFLFLLKCLVSLHQVEQWANELREKTYTYANTASQPGALVLVLSLQGIKRQLEGAEKQRERLYTYLYVSVSIIIMVLTSGIARVSL